MSRKRSGSRSDLRARRFISLSAPPPAERRGPWLVSARGARRTAAPPCAVAAKAVPEEAARRIAQLGRRGRFARSGRFGKAVGRREGRQRAAADRARRRCRISSALAAHGRTACRRRPCAWPRRGAARRRGRRRGVHWWRATMTRSGSVRSRQLPAASPVPRQDPDRRQADRCRRGASKRRGRSWCCDLVGQRRPAASDMATVRCDVDRIAPAATGVEHDRDLADGADVDGDLDHLGQRQPGLGARPCTSRAMPPLRDRPASKPASTAICAMIGLSAHRRHDQFGPLIRSFSFSNIALLVVLIAERVCRETEGRVAKLKVMCARSMHKAVGGVNARFHRANWS